MKNVPAAYLDSLNEAQKAPVLHKDGPLIDAFSILALTLLLKTV